MGFLNNPFLSFVFACFATWKLRSVQLTKDNMQTNTKMTSAFDETNNLHKEMKVLHEFLHMIHLINEDKHSGGGKSTTKT